eukprot:292812_1
MVSSVRSVDGKADVQILGESRPRMNDVLSSECLNFLGALHHTFDERRQELLRMRVERQARLDAGERPDFLQSTQNVRESNWKVAPIPKDIMDRRVEITGPVDRKMIINALNSGAKVFMADLEDSSTPTWRNCIDGQINLLDANRGTITFDDPRTGKHYELRENPAVLFVRPRGWHLNEDHIVVNGQPMSGSLVDFGIYFFNSAKIRVENGSAPYFYLPKMESHLEARLWNDVFNFSQDFIGMDRGTIRATVLIETILAAFEMDEILFELRDHSAGLNCGRWDYIFSIIKKFRNDSAFLLPDRSEVGMDKPFMSAYARLLVKTCHRRGIHAMGGMAAQIPIRNDPTANEAALGKVRKDKLMEVKAGHDGTWVAHPALVQLAMDIFDKFMPQENQIFNLRQDVNVTSSHLLELGVEECKITRAGLVGNIHVSILYTEAWLRGVGCVPINHLMEDAATAEIGRCQVWQWIRHEAKTDDGTVITKDLVQSIIQQEIDSIRSEMEKKGGMSTKLDLAAKIVSDLITQDELIEFLPSVAYPHVVSRITSNI